MKRMHRRLLAAVVVAVVQASALLALPAYAAPSPPPTPHPAAKPPAAQPSGTSSQLDASGLPKLQLSDHHYDPARSKEVPTLDPNVKQYDNPDNTHTLRIGLSPLVGLDASGKRGDLDLSLVQGGGGRLRPNRTMTPVTLAAMSGADMASIELAPGKTVELGAEGIKDGVIPAHLTSPSGDTLRYEGALADGTNMELSPLSTGVESSYVVSTAAAGESVRETLRLPSGYAARESSGAIEIVDQKGSVIATWSGGAATDSASRTSATAVTLQLDRVDNGLATARVVVDPKWLADRHRVYPVTIDPAVTESSSGATYVETGDGSSHWNGSTLWMGDTPSGVARSLIKFPVTSVPAHSRILNAQLQVDEMGSASCTPTAMEAHRILADWPTTVTWNNQPGFRVSPAESNISVASGSSGSCPEVYQQMDLTSLESDWYNNATGKFGVLLKAANESDPGAWKEFRGTGSQNPPLLDISYESYGSQPISINDGDTQPPVNSPQGAGFQGMTLTNQGSETWPANGAYQISYHLYKSDGTFIHDGPATAIPQTVAPGQSVSLRANIETSLPMGDYIIAWDMDQVFPQGRVFFSTYGIPAVNRNYHSDQPPTQPQLVSPASGSKWISVTPTLTASSTDPDGPHLQFLFRICTGADAESGSCTDSGWIDASSWTVPRGVLQWGGQYYWHAWARDNFPNPASVVPGGTPNAFMAVFPTTQQAWSFGSDPYADYQNGVNTAVGNYVYTTTDLSIPTIGPPLQVARTNNSMDSDTGLGLKPGSGTYGFGKWFGVGWSSIYETNMIFDVAGNAEVDYPDGRREFLASNGDGTYQPSFGFVSTVVPVVGPQGVEFYDLHHRDQSVWRFTPDGRLFSMTDAQGHVVQLTWNNPSNDCCASLQITDVTSGRSLMVTFSAPGDKKGRVSTIQSSPVTVGGKQQPLTWTYGYDSNQQLSSACDPVGACSTYTYVQGSNGPQLSGVKRGNGNSPLTLTYDSSGRVASVKDGSGNMTGYGYTSYTTPPSGAPADAAETTAATDALGRTVQSTYNKINQLLEHVNADGSKREYTYDQTGFLNSVKDENGNTTTYSNDAQSNVTQSQDGAGAITYREYDSHNHLTAVRDPRSSSKTDNTYLTTYTYDGPGNQTGEQTPAGSKTWSYSFGTEAAVGGGTVPANLLLSATDAMGHVTTYAYDAQGNLRKRVDPSGLVMEFTYDELGREISRKETSDSYPNGLVTTTGYDLDGRIATVSEPVVTDRVTSSTHQRVTTLAYDGNGNLTQSTVSDGSGGDASRSTSYGYDANDRQASVTDALGGVSTTSYDAVGNVVQSKDVLGRVTQTTYTSRNQPSQVTLLGFVDSGGHKRDLTEATYTYDPGGRKITSTDALGRRTSYAYDAADRLVKTTLLGYHNRDGSTRDVVLESRGYDKAGNLTSQSVGGGLRTTTDTYDAAGRLVSSSAGVLTGVARTTSYTYDANDNVLSKTVSQGSGSEQTLYHYNLDQGSRQDQVQVVNGSGGNLVTSHTYDQRGLVTSTTDPRGNVSGANPAAYTTTYAYDEAGRLASTVGPAVQVESGGSAPASRHPSELQGYDTFGKQAQSEDARGNVTTTSYDGLGRKASVAYPTYVTPGGTTINATESWSYDAAGNVLSWTDRRGQATSYAYDMRNLLVSQTDPHVSGQSVTGVTSYSYDDVGNRTGTTNQVGAQQSFTYDDRNRMRTSIQLVSGPGTPPSVSVFTTTYDYDDLGDQTYQATPLGEVTQSQYDAVGERTLVLDPLGNATQTTYDVGGRPLQVSDPLGRSTTYTYDEAGRRVGESQQDAGGTVLARQSWRYDAARNVITATDANGNATVSSYDALSQLTQVIEPVSASASITTSYGYDAAGDQTRVTDGNGHSTVMTYNAWGLPETQVLPSTQANPAAAGRTWTWTYGPGGQVVSEAQPGLTLSETYDELGRLTQESGTPAGGGSTTTSYGYDLAGRMISASGTAGGVSFGYDERGLLKSASGVAGSSSFGYDGDGQLVSRSDASGTATFGYDVAGNLNSISEPLTGIKETLGYDAAGELTSRAYGTGGPTRSYNYDGRGQLVLDTMKGPSGATVEQTGYSYDGNGNLTQRQVATGAGSAIDGYTYDQANRLSSWTNPQGAVTGYGWDGAGNRTQVGSQTATYDERNRLLSTSDGTTYGWSANGNLLSSGNGQLSTSYSYDGLNRLVGVQQNAQPPLSGSMSTSYAYDGLDRVVQRNGSAFSYSGQNQQPVSDGSSTYSQGVGGELLAVKSGGTALLTAENQHGDVAMTMDGAGNLKGSFVYDPFGASLPQASQGTPPNAGFQSAWTDPATATAKMGARWYSSGTGSFLTQDTLQVAHPSGSDGNRYLYGDANPIGYADPSGHFPCLIASWPFPSFGDCPDPFQGFEQWWQQQFGQQTHWNSWSQGSCYFSDSCGPGPGWQNADPPEVDTSGDGNPPPTDNPPPGAGWCGYCYRPYPPPSQRPQIPSGQRHLPRPPTKFDPGDGNLYLPPGVNPKPAPPALPPAQGPGSQPQGGCSTCTPLAATDPLAGLLPGMPPGGGPFGPGCGATGPQQDSRSGTGCQKLSSAAQSLAQWLASNPQIALQVCGLIPILGAPCNVALAVTSFSQGDYLQGGLFLVAAGASLFPEGGEGVDEAIDGAGGIRVALGIEDHLTEFANAHDALRWEKWADPTKLFTEEFMRVVGDPANEIHFNLQGIDSPWSAVQRVASQSQNSSMTDWELTQIYQNPAWWSRIKFFDGPHKAVPNPFQ